jgi:NTE family protein
MEDPQEKNQAAAMVTEIVPVLAGGGARLPAHVGVLEALAELGIRHEHVVGVSGGSIVGAFYCAGFPIESIRDIAEETDFSQFLGSNLLSLMRTGGLSSGEGFFDWMNDKLEGRTFKDLKHDFHVIATDVRAGRPVIFNRQTNPDMLVARAVRYSISIPLLFSFNQLDGKLIVDGSILSEDALRRDWSGTGTPVVVFKLRGEQEEKTGSKQSMLPIREYLGMLVNTFMTTLSREFVSQDFWLSTVIIDTGNVTPTSFKVDAETKRQLHAAGYDTVMNFLPHKLALSAQEAQ